MAYVCQICCVCFALNPPSYLLTYLIGRNNSINGFLPGATHLSRRFCFLCAYTTLLHQSITGLPRFGPSNGCKIYLFLDFRRSPHQIPVSPDHPPPYEQDMAEPAQLLNINTLHNVSMSLRSTYSSLLNLMSKLSPTRTGPKILRVGFFSCILSRLLH